MPFSYSKVECHNSCAYKYYLRYIKKVEVEPDQSANNPLYLGTAIHEGIEKRSIDAAIESYKKNYSELTEANEFEIEKLKTILPKAIAEIPEGEYEKCLRDPDGFVGYIDLLVEVEPGVFDLYDFKHSNNVERYKNSSQVSVYKYYFERITGNKVRNIYYVMIPKYMDTLTESSDIQKLNEGLEKYKNDSVITFELIEYDKKKVGYFFAHKVLMEKDTNFPRRKTRGCAWCEYKDICEGDQNEQIV